jgi:hypothetical protein
MRDWYVISSCSVLRILYMFGVLTLVYWNQSCRAEEIKWDRRRHCGVLRHEWKYVVEKEKQGTVAA